MTKTLKTKPLCIRIKKVADELDISLSSVYGLVRSGELETIAIGKTRLVLQSSIEDFVERQRTPEFKPRQTPWKGTSQPTQRVSRRSIAKTIR